MDVLLVSERINRYPCQPLSLLSIQYCLVSFILEGCAEPSTTGVEVDKFGAPVDGSKRVETPTVGDAEGEPELEENITEDGSTDDEEPSTEGNPEETDQPTEQGSSGEEEDTDNSGAGAEPSLCHVNSTTSCVISTLVCWH